MQAIPKFFGDDKSPAAYEALALQVVPQELREREADLFATKWFDYRSWHPVRATYYWAHCYREAFKRFAEMNFDANQARFAVGLDENVFASRDANAAVTARQALDKIGCRYPFAMHFIVRRYSDRGWFTMPRPNQIYSEELIWDIADAWKIECSASLQMPSEARFFDTSGTQTKQEYIDWIVAQVKARGVDHWRGLSRLLREGVLTSQQALEHFDPGMVERATRAVGR